MMWMLKNRNCAESCQDRSVSIAFSIGRQHIFPLCTIKWLHYKYILFYIVGSFRVWRVSNRYDKKEALDESEIALNIDHETIEGSR